VGLENINPLTAGGPNRSTIVLHVILISLSSIVSNVHCGSSVSGLATAWWNISEPAPAVHVSLL